MKTIYDELDDLLASQTTNAKRLYMYNSPPNSGKDTVCDFLESRFGFEHVRFKTKLFDLVKTIYSVPDDIWELLYTRENKDTPSLILDGKSPRQAMIFVSEQVIKPKFGNDYFGVALLKTIKSSDNKFFCCSDSGFPEEAVPIINYLTTNNVEVVRIYRPGETFSKYRDSRGYLSPTMFDAPPSFFDIQNDQNVDILLERAVERIIETMTGATH